MYVRVSVLSSKLAEGARQAAFVSVSHVTLLHHLIHLFSTTKEPGISAELPNDLPSEEVGRAKAHRALPVTNIALTVLLLNYTRACLRCLTLGCVGRNDPRSSAHNVATISTCVESHAILNHA